jgi:type II secretory pathway pseudopilin PulG
MNKTLIACILSALSATAMAKLPAPSDEAKAKAAEAAAKTAHTAKADAYLLCKSQDKVVAHVQKTNKAQAGKPVATAPCTDPGKFVYTPPEAATPAAAAPAAAPTAPAAPSPVAAKKS